MIEMRRVSKTGGGLILGKSSENSEGFRQRKTLVMLEVMNMVTRSGRGGGRGSGVAMVDGIGSKIAGPEDVVLIELGIVVEGGGGTRV